MITPPYPLPATFFCSFQSYTGPAENNIVENKYKVREGGEKGMKALTWQGANSVKVIDADIPDITQDTDVILKVTATTICGSDLHLYHGEIVALQKGDLLGHEFAGIVDRVGPAVKNLKVGLRVSSLSPCGARLTPSFLL
jgi:hypothetical protein